MQSQLKTQQNYVTEGDRLHQFSASIQRHYSEI